MTADSLKVEGLLRQCASAVEETSSRTCDAMQRAMKQLDAALALVSATGAQPVEARLADHVVAIVKRTLASQQLPSPCDSKLAVHLFARFNPAEIEALLAGRPRLWRRFVDHFFERRLQPGFEEQEWLALVRRAPADVRLLNGAYLDRGALLRDGSWESARAVAASIGPTGELSATVQSICGPGLLRLSWQYTAAVVGCLARLRPQRVWSELGQDPILEGLLLPRREPAGASWFRNGPSIVRTGIARNTGAHAMTAAALIRRELAEATDGRATDWRHVYFHVQSSEFRDPRESPDPRAIPSGGWLYVKRLDASAWDEFVIRLLGEDISFFFENVQMDEDRRRFWTRYVRQVVRTRIYMSPSSRSRLDRKFGHADPKIAAALRRARDLRNSFDVDAFCLYFSRFVAVEFSKTGNACFLYGIEDFDRLSRGRIAAVGDLKDPKVGVRLLHHQGWEALFGSEMMRRGVSEIR